MVNTREHFRDLREIWRLEGFFEMLNYDLDQTLTKYGLANSIYPGSSLIYEVKEQISNGSLIEDPRIVTKFLTDLDELNRSPSLYITTQAEKLQKELLNYDYVIWISGMGIVVPGKKYSRMEDINGKH